MTKKDLLDLLQSVADDEQIAIGGLWLQTDAIEDGKTLSKNEWHRFVHWMEKYQDSFQDYAEAIHYATQPKND